MKKQLLLLCLTASLGLSSCNLLDDYGKKIDVGTSEVFYKGNDVSEADAQKGGNFLLQHQLLSDKKKSSAQLTKEKGNYRVRLILNPKELKESTMLQLWKLQGDLSEEVFGGKQVGFSLTDDTFKDMKVLEPSAVVRVSKSAIYYNTDKFANGEAKKLGDFLYEKKYISDEKGVDVLLTKEQEAPVVRLMVDKNLIKKDDESVTSLLGYWQYLLQNDILNDKRTKLLLTSTEYEDLNQAPEITAQQKEDYEKQLQD